MSSVSIVGNQRTSNDVLFERTNSGLYVDGSRLATLELYPKYYAIDWPTNAETERGINAIRDFFESIMADGSYRPNFDKDLFARFGDQPPQPKIDFHEFQDSPDKVLDYFRKLGVDGIRVNGPYADVSFSTAREFGVISHIDLSDKIPYLMQRTYTTQLPDIVLPEITRELAQALGRYGR